MVQLLYPGNEVIERECIANFHVEIRRPLGARRWWKPQVRFLLDGELLFEPYPLDHAFPLLEWGLNWCIAMRSHQYLMLHAGVVAQGDRALILPATPGSGKSTLAAGLACRGWRFLSDEFGLVDPARCNVLPLPRAIALKNESIDVIRDFAPDAILGPRFLKTRKGTLSHMQPPEEGLKRQDEPADPAWIIFPRFHPGAPAQLNPIPASLAFTRLAQNAFNYRLLGETGFGTLETLVRGCRYYSLEFGNLESACEALSRLAAD